MDALDTFNRADQRISGDYSMGYVIRVYLF
jgi:hypothetical protein